MNSFRGKTIIVTGATHGLGKAIAEALTSMDANLVLVSRGGLSTLNLKSDKILNLSGDIRSEADIAGMVTAAVQKFGQIDVLINNAGVFIGKNLDKAKESDYDSVMDTNVKGMFLFTKAVVPYMKKRKSGLIINIGSKISHKTNLTSGKTIYAASKYAVEGFSLALQRELQPYKIRVTCLLPSTLRTFFSLSSRKYLDLKAITKIIALIIELDDINFDSLIFQSMSQYL